MRLIAVCGAGECDAEVAALAREVGRRVAEAGFGLICGGLSGVMEAAAQGAVEAGGATIAPRRILAALLERVRDVLEEDEPRGHMLVLGWVHVAPHLIGGMP